MTDALALIADLRARGIELSQRGDKLHILAPEGTLTPELRAVLRQHKADILAALRDPCCPACGRRAGPPIDIADGCLTHGVTPEQAAHWWRLAEEMKATVSWCHCCGGPAPNEALRCRKCEGA